MKKISLLVKPETLSRFTTLLQSGIYLDVAQGKTLGGLLATLPGFTEEYIQLRVQTIFVNGLPADDLHQQLFGTEAVVAISAAMPGLAGAIFRKGGVHASLRTETAPMLSDTEIDGKPMKIRLKFFNIIAVERGETILHDGCVIASESLEKFLDYRPPLFADILEIQVNGTGIGEPELKNILHSGGLIHLSIRGSHGC